jgi:cytochrome c biogenesis protein CcmG/thiol:disulfide interchange protein DsbE
VSESESESETISNSGGSELPAADPEFAEQQSDVGAGRAPQSAIRTRLIPALALVMVVGLVGLLAYSLFAPDRARFADNCRVQALGYCVYDEPREARAFTVETFDGQTISLDDYAGKVVVLNFWASWCDPCRDETPLLETAYSRLGDDVVLLGINIQDNEDDARAFLDEYGVTYQSSRTGGDPVSVDYGVAAVPETFVIDGNGKVVAKLIGPVTSVDQLQAMVGVAQ